MEKTITFNIPEGYVIDKEKSTDNNIVLKLDVSEFDVSELTESTRVRTWEEYCEKMKGKISYYMDLSSGITLSIFGNCPFLSEFETEEEVKVFEAYSKLLKLRKDWIGEWQPDWKAFNNKYVIGYINGNIGKTILYHLSRPLSFPTKKMRDEFFNTFRDILEIAKPLL